MRKKFKHLTWTQRLQLEAYLKARLPFKRIAELLEVHISTLYREVKRGRYEHLIGSTWIVEERYSPDIADNKYRENLANKGADLKIGNDHALAEYIEKRIVDDKLSPGAVIGEIKRKKLAFKTTICVNTLYSYIEKNVFFRLSSKNLVFGNRKRKSCKVTRASKAPRGLSIEKRPGEINSRKTFGHWEMDCVCGPTKSTLLVLSERLTRKEFIFKMKDQKSDSVIQCLNALEGKFGKKFASVFKSITVDNGSEFVNYSGMEKSRYAKKRRTTIYYCHPYSAYERGTNERINREIRRLIPKGSDISKYSESDVKAVEKWINTYPRAILGYLSSEELFADYIAQI